MGDPLAALLKSSIVDLAAVREAVHGPFLPRRLSASVSGVGAIAAAPASDRRGSS